jgi:preprotein translocase subunit SecF
VIVGTYSSIYTAPAIALELKVTTTDLLAPQREEDDAQEELP